MSLRLKRLQFEYDRLMAAYSSHDKILVKPIAGDPPERYEVRYRVKGLERLASGELVSRDDHTIEISLPADYPRTPPICKMKTPVFHPNIDVFDICTSDHWAAQETLVDLVVRIGQIISYQSHNTKSPLNAEAARWCDDNRNRLPVDSSDLHPQEIDLTECVRRISSATEEVERALTSLGTIKTSAAALQVLSQNMDRLHRLDVDAAALKDADDSSPVIKLSAAKVRLQHLLDMVTALRPLEAEGDRLTQLRKRSLELGRVMQLAERELQNITYLPAPPWLSGPLAANSIADASNRIGQHMRMLGSATTSAEESAGLHVNHAAVQSSATVLPELRGLFDHLSSLADQGNVEDRLADGVGQAHSLLRRMSQCSEALETLGAMIAAYGRVGETQRRLRELASSLERTEDGIIIHSSSGETLLPAGGNIEVLPMLTIRCRVRSSSGNISVCDNRGRLLHEFDSEVASSFPLANGEITVTSAGPASKSIFDSAAACRRILDSMTELHALPSIPSELQPLWWTTRGRLIDPSLRDDLRRRATQIATEARDRFFTARARTMMLDLGEIFREGEMTAERLTDAFDLGVRLHQQLSLLESKGTVRDGSLQLKPKHLERHQHLNRQLNDARGSVSLLVEQLNTHVRRCCTLRSELNRLLREGRCPSLEQDAKPCLQAAEDAARFWQLTLRRISPPRQ